MVQTKFGRLMAQVCPYRILVHLFFQLPLGPFTSQMFFMSHPHIKILFPFIDSPLTTILLLSFILVFSSLRIRCRGRFCYADRVRAASIPCHACHHQLRSMFWPPSLLLHPVGIVDLGTPLGRSCPVLLGKIISCVLA
jgi:hypothetical protein